MVDRFSSARQLAVVASLAASLLLGGCKEKAEAAPAQPTPAPAPKAAVRPAAPSDSARVETSEYVVALAAGASEGTVTITAKPPLHLNADYPTAFKPDPGTVAFDGAKVPLGQETKKPCASKGEDVCESSSSLKYTGATSGAKVSGTVLFSVCEPERCLIEKAQVAAAVP
jgi:hypothetical protein